MCDIIKRMNTSYGILITAGGTQEPIDSVRTITNTSTGKLGSIIADECASVFPTAKIFYICAQTAVRPTSTSINCIPIQSTYDLQNAVTKVMSEEKIDAVVHSMAISDYTVASLCDVETLAKKIKSSCKENECCVSEETIVEHLLQNDVRTGGKKVSSNVKHPLLLLKQTPKIISLFRKMSESAIIVGFKLLSGVSENELIKVAYNLLQKNGCNFVLANDTQNISDKKHKACLVDANKNIVHFETKTEIAKGIANAISKALDAKH